MHTDWDPPPDPPLSGTVGFTDASPEGDFDRAKVSVYGEQYIIRNNNCGNHEGTNLILQYSDNDFVVVEGSVASQGDCLPAVFPSIYIGANGDTDNGIYTTSATDNLPMMISSIASIETSFAWSGSTASFNAAYCRRIIQSRSCAAVCSVYSRPPV